MTGDLFEAPVLEKVRKRWKTTIKGDGGKCPCCDRFGRIYPRRINGTMARSLLWLGALHREPLPDGWIDVPETAPRWLVRSNQLASLRWWGLVERKEPKPDEDVKHTGLWRITARGRDFLTGKIKVPLVVLTYAGEVQGFGDADTWFDDCLDRRFRNSETMESTTNA